MRSLDVESIATFLYALESLPTSLPSEDWQWLSIKRFNFLHEWQTFIDHTEILEIDQMKSIINEQPNF